MLENNKSRGKRRDIYSLNFTFPGLEVKFPDFSFDHFLTCGKHELKADIGSFQLLKNLGRLLYSKRTITTSTS